MKHLLTIIIINLFALLLPIISYGQQTINATILHDGLQREYILYIPESYSPETATPLVFNYHGYTSNAYEQMNYGDFRPIADTANFIIVHPMGTVDMLGNTHWNVGWGTSTVDDLGFTDALIDSIAADYHINFDRIYSTGMSNGGFMSYYVACHLSNRFAAIASVTGSMNVGQTSSCNCLHPMPTMEFHGTADNTVPYDGNTIFLPIEDVVSYWVDFNNCNTEAIVTEMPDLDPNDGSTAVFYLYENGTEGTEVQHYKIINGGHAWPGSAYDIGGTNYDIDASSLIWKFFARYDINGLINATAIQNVIEYPEKISIYPNPCFSVLYIDTPSNSDAYYELFSTLGILIESGRISSSQNNIDLSHLIPNTYFLKIENQTYRIIKL